jgi:hypothetical protein
MSASEAVKLEREKRKTLNEARALAIITDPQVVGLLTLLGGLYAAQAIPWSEDETRRNALKGIATGGVVLMALGRAGIGGWPAVAAAGVAGAASEATTANTRALFSLNPADWAGLFG